jgi:hypothetical protein
MSARSSCQLHVSSDGGDSSINNLNETTLTHVVSCGGVWVQRESGVRLSVLCWYVWQESGFSLREHVFTFNLL